MEHVQNNTCRNCHHLLPENAMFCPVCGQKNTDGRITFKELFSQFLSNLLNFDGRIFQTMGALLVPGKLTKNFFEGKHIRYYHPVRLFILSGALFIALLSLLVSKSNIDSVDRLWEDREKSYLLKKSYQDIDTLIEDIKLEMPDTVSSVAFDTLKVRYSEKYKLSSRDSVEITGAISFSFDDRKKTGMQVAIDDLVNLPEDSLALKYNVTDFWERIIFIQNIRIQKSIKSFFFYMIGNILWMVLIMMPMLALALKLIYYRQPYLYIEHLIFSFHTHTFGFLLYAVLFLISSWFENEVYNFAFIVIAFYLLFAMKRFYGQSWWKTIFKFIAVNIFYMIIFLVAAFIMSFVSIFLF